MTITVAHVARTFLPLTEGWIYDQLRFTRRYRNIVLARRIANDGLFPWPNVHPFAGTLGHLRREVSCLTHENAQLLHAHFGDRGVAALPLAKRSRLPLVTSFYGRDLSRRAGLRRLFSRGAAFLAEGPYSAERLCALGASADRILIHRLGVDLTRFEFRERRIGPGEQLRLLMVGRFVEKKGFSYGIRAFAKVFRDLPVHLTIAGDAGPGRREQRIKRELQQIAAECGDRTSFLGFVVPDRIQSLLLQHHVFLQPSVTAADGDSEGGHPVILTQAAATGMPIIASRHCDIPEIVIDGKTGWLCDEKNVGQIADAIVDAARSVGKFDLLGRCARELVAEKYDIRKETLDSVYDQFLNRLSS